MTPPVPRFLHFTPERCAHLKSMEQLPMSALMAGSSHPCGKSRRGFFIRNVTVHSRDILGQRRLSAGRDRTH